MALRWNLGGLSGTALGRNPYVGYVKTCAFVANNSTYTTCMRQPLVFSTRFRYLNFQKSFRSERKKVLKMTLFWTTLVSHELVWLFIVKESQA